MPLDPSRAPTKINEVFVGAPARLDALSNLRNLRLRLQLQLHSLLSQLSSLKIC